MRFSLTQAATKTISYAAHFDFILTREELHHWLIADHPVPFSAIQKLPAKLLYSTLTTLSPSRRTSLRYTNQKIAKAKRAVILLKLIPTIKLIALTGSLTMNNARRYDDIDLMFITSANTLWLTRPLVFLLLRLFNLRRPPRLSHTSRLVSDKICDNLWLDTTALALPGHKRSLYTAHEVLQIKPLLNRNSTYERFITANSWTKKHLANAYSLITTSLDKDNKIFPLTLSSRTDAPVTQGRSPWELVSPVRGLNSLAFFFQHLYMKPKITREYLTPHAAFFHPNDPSPHLDTQP